MRYILLIIAILFINSAQTQTDSTYHINRYGMATYSSVINNPAFAGVEGKHTLNIQYRDWEKWDLKEFDASFSSALGKKKNLGIGAYYTNVKYPYSSTKEANISVSYRIGINDKADIRFGLSAISFYRLKFDIEKLIEGAAHPDDPLLQSMEENNDYLRYNTGLWFNYSKFYFGFSYLNFWQYDLNEQKTEFNPNFANYRVITGYDYQLSSKWGISPNVQIRKATKGKTYFLNLSLFADYSNFVFAGFTYDYSDKTTITDLKIVAGILIYKRIRIHGAYKFSTDKHHKEHIGFNFWELGMRLQY